MASEHYRFERDGDLLVLYAESSKAMVWCQFCLPPGTARHGLGYVIDSDTEADVVAELRRDLGEVDPR